MDAVNQIRAPRINSPIELSPTGTVEFQKSGPDHWKNAAGKSRTESRPVCHPFAPFFHYAVMNGGWGRIRMEDWKSNIKRRSQWPGLNLKNLREVRPRRKPGVPCSRRENRSRGLRINSHNPRAVEARRGVHVRFRPGNDLPLPRGEICIRRENLGGQRCGCGKQEWKRLCSSHSLL